MRSLLHLILVCLFMVCTCMTCDDYDDLIYFHNATNDTLSVAFHTGLEDSFPGTIHPGVTWTIGSMDNFQHIHSYILSVYAYRRYDESVSMKDREYQLLYRRVYTRRTIERLGQTITYPDPEAEE